MSISLSLTVIARNEAATLASCLASVRGLVSDIVVVDTGSTDATREIAAQHGARVFDFPWSDDFAAARNECLKYVSGDWVLWLDADESFDDANRDKLRSLLANLHNDNAAYVMTQRSPSAAGAPATVVTQVRLFRRHPDIRWDYRVHEQIIPAIRKAGHDIRWTDIAIEHTGYQDPATRAAKVQRNLRLLQLDLADRPEDPFILFNLGWAFTDLGRPADALPLLQRSLQRVPPDASIVRKLYALLAQCHRLLRQPADALAACRAGRVRCPDDAELLYVEAVLLHQRGDLAAAERSARQLLPTDASTTSPAPDAAAVIPSGTFASADEGLRGHRARHLLAAICHDAGRSTEAEQHWKQVLADTPSFLPARLDLAGMCLRHKRLEDAERLLADIPLEAQQAIEVATLHARLLLARQDFQAARLRLEEIIAQAPQALPPRILLTHVLLQEGRDPLAAERTLREVLQRAPGQAESWRNLGVLLQRQKRVAEALTVTQSGRAHCPDDPELMFVHAVLLRERGDVVNAEATLLHLLQGDDGSGAARERAWRGRHQLALIYREQERLPEAVSQWRAVLADKPDFVPARVFLGRGQEVQTLLASAPTTVAEDLGLMLLRARLQLACKDFAAARHILDAVLHKQPHLLEALILRSYAFLQEDSDHTAAEEALQAVLAVDPANAEARHNLALLRKRHNLAASGSAPSDVSA